MFGPVRASRAVAMCDQGKRETGEAMPKTGQPVNPLVAELLSASLTATHAAADEVIDSLTRARERLEAEVDLIRSGITDALAGAYMPSPQVLLDLLWPSHGEIEAEAKSRRQGT